MVPSLPSETTLIIRRQYGNTEIIPRIGDVVALSSTNREADGDIILRRVTAIEGDEIVSSTDDSFYLKEKEIWVSVERDTEDISSSTFGPVICEQINRGRLKMGFPTYFDFCEIEEWKRNYGNPHDDAPFFFFGRAILRLDSNSPFDIEGVDQSQNLILPEDYYDVTSLYKYFFNLKNLLNGGNPPHPNSLEVKAENVNLMLRKVDNNKLSTQEDENHCQVLESIWPYVDKYLDSCKKRH
eukprot:g3313.t1